MSMRAVTAVRTRPHSTRTGHGAPACRSRHGSPSTPRCSSSARAWVATGTYTAERDYLAAHPELLEAAADTAVAEALLAVPEDEAGRYTALRRPRNRTASTPPTGRCCSASWPRNSPMPTPAVSVPCSSIAAMTCSPARSPTCSTSLPGRQHEQAVAAQRATALLNLARTGHAEPVFEALAEPGQFPRPAA